MWSSDDDKRSESKTPPQLEKVREGLLKTPGRKLEGKEYSLLPKAAVGVILREDLERGLIVLLLKRENRESDPWSGHMAFPGGRMKDSDKEMINTARREVMEETGINLARCELLGTLDELPPGNRSVTVTPFVFLDVEKSEVEIETKEIADYVWAPVNFFANKRNAEIFRAQMGGTFREFVSFPYLGKYIVWGMTLRIIDDFLGKIM